MWRKWTVAVVVAVVAVGCDRGGTEEPPPPRSTAEASGDAALAARFAPVVWLAEDERSLPQDAADFVRGSQLWFDHSPACTDTEPVAERVDPRRLGDGGYTHPGVRSTAPHGAQQRHCTEHTEERFASDGDRPGFYLDPPDRLHRGEGTTAPVYWERHREGDGRTAYVYWFFYGYNDFVNKHEGDWERVAVQVRDDEPLAVTFAKHGTDPCMVPWRELDRRGERPRVYSARDSHGSYPDEGHHYVGPPPLPVYDETSSDVEWDAAARLRPVDREPWYGYRGWWGPQRALPGTDGPMGPYPGRSLPGIFTEKRCGPPESLPPGFAGEWETREPVRQDPVVEAYHMRVVLGEQNSVRYRTNWTDEFPELACTGVLAPTAATDTWLELRETITTDTRANCVHDGAVTLVLNGDHLDMAYTGGGVTATATLHRRAG